MGINDQNCRLSHHSPNWGILRAHALSPSNNIYHPSGWKGALCRHSALGKRGPSRQTHPKRSSDTRSSREGPLHTPQMLSLKKRVYTSTALPSKVTISISLDPSKHGPPDQSDHPSLKSVSILPRLFPLKVTISMPLDIPKTGTTRSIKPPLLEKCVYTVPSYYYCAIQFCNLIQT